MECRGDRLLLSEGVVPRSIALAFGLVGGSGPPRCSGVDQIRSPLPPLGFGRTFYPGTHDFSQATPLDVTPGGDLRNIEIPLQREA
jgi:hypothetical protein